MKDITIDLLIKTLIDDFKQYQIDWLTNHCDIEFEPELEALTIGFLEDTADCYISEHTS